MDTPADVIGNLRLQAPRTAVCAFCGKRRKCLQREHVGAQIMVCRGCELFAVSSFQLYLVAAARELDGEAIAGIVAEAREGSATRGDR